MNTKIQVKSNTFLSQSRPLYMTAKKDEGELIVEPGEIRFESVSPGVLYIMTFSVRNNTKVAQRIRISQPHSGVFALNYIPSGTIAPGLDIRAEIECQLPIDSNNIIFTDKIVATMGSYRIDIPIFACKPFANIKFKRILNCGNLILNQSHYAELEFENLGDIVGKVKLNCNSDSFIKSMTPTKFDLNRKGNEKCTLNVKFQLSANETGQYRELIRVSIAGTIEDAFIEISANFVDPKLVLLTEDSKGMLEIANFGNLFFGETKVIKGVLVNSGPLPLNFTMLYGEDEATGDTDAPQTDEILIHYQKSLTFFPPDGLIKPFSQLSVELIFKPIIYVPKKGFSKQLTEESSTPMLLARRVNIDCSDADQRITVNMQGEAVSPALVVKPSTLRFGDCPVNDRRDILITVANVTKYATAFEFPVVANFKFSPNKAILQGRETISINASFLPPQLGEFKSLIKLSVANGLQVIEVRAIGCANEPGERKELLGGADKLPEDFKKLLKFVNPEEEAATRYEKQKAIEAKNAKSRLVMLTSLKDKIGDTSYIALPKVKQTEIPTSDYERKENDSPSDVTVGAVSAASSKERDYIYGINNESISKPLDANHPMLVKRNHNRAYNDFLQQSHTLRQETKQQKAHLRSTKLHGAIDFRDPFGVNMGIDRDLDEPVLKLPVAGEPLWLASGNGDGDGNGPNRIPVDENRLIVKKYSNTPATQAELRDCSVELSQDDLKLVVASHKTIDFGKVSVGSVSSKNFSVSNDLTQSVMVKCLELDGELQQSKHLCQIIPQGCIAGFDLFFSSRQIGKVRKVFIWKINNIHVSKVTVLAEVVPIELVISHKELIMEFPTDSLSPTLSADIVLTNPGNAPADFLWGNAGAFQCNPDAGTINPYSTNHITITWSPLLGKRNQEELGLHITGGIDQTLKVVGILDETKGEFTEKRIALGVMAVGTQKIINTQLKNIGNYPLAFFLNNIDDRLGIIATPTEELVQPGEFAAITLQITPKFAITYDNITISAKLRGGKQVSLKLTGSSVIPQLSFHQDNFIFGPVTVGTEYRLPFEISNKTSILTTLFLDLTSFPEFYPSIIDDEQPDYVLASVLGTVNNDQEDSIGNQIIRVKDPSFVDESNGGSRGGNRTRKIIKNVWNIYILPNATLRANLVFRPTLAKHFSFKLPLFLQGIMDDKSLNRDVNATAHASTLSITSYLIDFGDRVVSRDPLSRVSYFLETVIKNTASKRGVTFEIVECNEVAEEFSDAKDVPKPEVNPLADESANQIFFVAPTKGSLAPGSSTPIRITFQPQSSANYSKKLELYIKDQPDPSRPYLTLLCQGSGVFPRLTFSHQHVELPNVPLGITSRTAFIIYNNGYNALAIKHRISPNIPIPLEISYPDGQQIGVMIEKIRVVISAKSENAVSWLGKIEFYDQDGERFFISVSGCTDNCLLTNYPFARDYTHEYGFVGIDEQPIRFLKKTLIAELRQQEAKKKEELRRLRSLERMRAVEGKTSIESDSNSKGVKNVSPSKRKDDSSIQSKSTKRSIASEYSDKLGNDNEGIDISKADSSLKFYDEKELVFLMKWLNKNICQTKFETDRFPYCVLDKQGDIVIECIELMSGKKIPNLKSDEFDNNRTRGKVTNNSDDNEHHAEHKKKNSDKQNKILSANKIVYKYQQVLNFLINNGALLTHINPVNLLDLESHLYAQEYDLTRDQNVRFTPAMLNERRKYWEQSWLYSCKKSWLEIIYQSLKVFILSRVNYKDYSSMPGVVLLDQTSAPPPPPVKKGGKEKKHPNYPKELSPSNIFTHSEAVLLAWASYHLERGAKLHDEGVSSGSDGNGNDSLSLINFNKRIADLDSEFKDLTGYCKIIHSHIADATSNGQPLSGYTALDSTKGDDLFSNFQDMFRLLKIDFDLLRDELTVSTRNTLLMILHMYLTLPNFIPKTKIEFIGDLGVPIKKQIELKNPSKKSISYEVTLVGSTDFSIQSEEIVIPPESSIDFLVVLNAKLFDPVQAKLTFWSVGLSGLATNTMCFSLMSNIIGRKPSGDIINKTVHLFEQDHVSLQLKSPFGKDAVYRISLYVQSIPTNVIDYLQIGGSTTQKQPKPKGRKQTFEPVLPHVSVSANNNHALSVAERKAKEEESELELTFRQPFWVNEETIALSKSINKTINIYMLPFVMGKYTCQVVFLEKDTGEFCKEIHLDVGLPKPFDRLDFSALKDGYTTIALRLASKNLAFEKAFTLITDNRIKNPNKKIRARTIFQSLLSSSVVDEEIGQSNFSIEFLSQFFEYRKQLSFVSEYMRQGKNEALGKGSANKIKKMLKSIIETVPPEEINSNDTLNTALISFGAPRAGHYQSLAVVYSQDNPYDVRVLDISANVGVPDAKMALEFNAPARQLIKQQIPITNETKKEWNLLINCIGKGFSAPKTVLVPIGSTASVEVTFYTITSGRFEGQLMFRNTSDSSDNFEYKLIGIADEPLAENDLQFKCVARQKKRCTIKLNQIEPVLKTKTDGNIDSNNNSVIQVFDVESDLPYVRFSEKFELASDVADFEFVVNSPIGGVFTGTFTFIDKVSKVSMWYTITLEIASPTEEKSIDVDAIVRKAAVVEITLENPTQEAISFDVMFKGGGLIGENTVELSAGGSSIYELIYSPLIAGKFTGQISFTNDFLGVLWYKLNLNAIPAEPTVLDAIECMIGSSTSIVAPLDNPLTEQVTFAVIIEDTEHFTVTPEKITLSPYAQSSFNIHFRPSVLNEQIFSKIILRNPKFGEIQYLVSGIGLLPGTFPVVFVDAPLGEMGSQNIVFRNPFPHPLPLDVILTHADKTPNINQNNRRKATVGDENAFALLMKKSTGLVIPAKSNYHIALSFSPTKMGAYEAVIQIRSVVGGRSLLWCYPIYGLAEAGSAYRLPMMKVACKESLMKDFSIPLEGIPKSHDLEELSISDFSIENKIDDNFKTIVIRTFRAQTLEIVELSPDSKEAQSGRVNSGPIHYGLRCRMLFEPLKTFSTTIDMIIQCKSRGKWRVKLELEATDPEPDDIIKLVAPVGGSDKVSFKLSNRFLGYSSFQAYFSSKSSPHFYVSPTIGSLAPYGQEGTTFVITFAPTEYGTIELGTLNIVTEDAQWSYEVKGSYPSTVINQANIKSKIDNNRQK